MKTAKVILKSALFSFVSIISTLINMVICSSILSGDLTTWVGVVAIVLVFVPFTPIVYLFYYPVRNQCKMPWLYTITTIVLNIIGCCILIFCFQKNMELCFLFSILPTIAVITTVSIITLFDVRKEKLRGANRHNVLATVLKSCLWVFLVNAMVILPSVYLFNTYDRFAEDFKEVSYAMNAVPFVGMPVLTLVYSRMREKSNHTWLRLLAMLSMHFLCQFLWLFLDVSADWSLALVIIPVFVVPGYTLITCSILFDLGVAIYHKISDKKKKKLMSEGKPLTVIEETETV